MIKEIRKSRWTALALTAAMVVTASGVATPAQAAPKKLTIGFVVHVIGNPFINQIIEAAKMAAKDLNVTLKVTGPAGAEGDAPDEAWADGDAAGGGGASAEGGGGAGGSRTGGRGGGGAEGGKCSGDCGD